MKDIFDSSGRKQLKLMVCLTIAVDSIFITLMETQLIALNVLSSRCRVKKNEGEKKRGRRTEGKRERAEAIAISASIRATSKRTK